MLHKVMSVNLKCTCEETVHSNSLNAAYTISPHAEKHPSICGNWEKKLVIGYFNEYLQTT